MKHSLMVLALCSMVSVAYAGDTWSGLWRNADQQGEALLQHGDARAAANTYTDPERKAYAQLKAGDYDSAARAYAALNSNDARYNQGNALALQGDLQAALNAYDAVLKSDPNNRDARHNRDLVAKAMKEQQSQQSPDNKQDGKSKQDKPNDQKQGQDGAGKGGAQKDQGKSGDQAKEGDQKNGGESKSGSNGQSGAGNQQAAKAKPDQNGKPTDGAPGKPADNQAAAQQGSSGAATPAKPPGENSAQQDAMASLGKSNDNNKAGAGVGSQTSASKVAADAPLSEQQIAQDQWLRAIPDDPGGLLKRKFLIEHMMRQQKEQQ